MKIVFAVTNDLTYDQRMQRICRSLSQAGYAVELIGRERDFSIPLASEPYEQRRLRCIFNNGKLFYLEYNLRLLFYLTFLNFDAACAIDLDTIVPVCIIGKLKGAKLAYDAHEYFTEVPEVINRPLVKKVWQWVEAAFVPQFDLTYTVSKGLAQLFTDKYSKPFEVIMNAPVLKAEALSVSSQSNPPVLLYQGALNEGRGLEHLIEAMSGIDAKLLLAGEGDLSDEFRKQVKQLQLESKVKFLGYVKPHDLERITKEATIGINLLENKGLSYYYSLSNKFFDYIHAGIPQVCIDFPEYRHLNEQYHVAVLAKNCSLQEIKGAINRLLSEPSLYEELKKNCFVCATRLNWQEEEKKLTALYHELLR